MVYVCVQVHRVRLILLKPKPDIFLAGHSARKNANKRMQKMQINLTIGVTLKQIKSYF